VSLLTLGAPGFARHTRSGRVIFVAPEGEGAGRIEVRERVRPLARLRDLLAELGVDRERVVPVPIHNEEAEQGVMVTARQGSRQVDVALLVGDEFAAVLVGTTARAEHFARTSELVAAWACSLPLWLGERRRLTLYPPPPGWRGVARDLEAEWYAPTFPRDPSRLTVWPAIPSGGATAAAALAMLAPGAEATRHPSGHGLLWLLGEVPRPRGRARAAVAVDDTYLYALRLEAPHDQHDPVLLSVVDGMLPVPRVAPRRARPLSHWTE